MKKNEDKVFIRETQFDDYDAIEALKKQYHMQPMLRKSWCDLWQKNPYYDTKWPIGWVLESEVGKVVGSFANIPMRYELDGCSWRVAVASTWVVEPHYRKKSLKLLYAYLRQKDVDLLLITTANKQAARVYEGLKLRKPPVKHCDKAYFWITHPKGFAQSVLITKSIPFNAVLKYPLGTAIFLVNLFKQQPLIEKHKRTEHTIIEYAEFSEEFDVFWKNNPARSNEFMAQRDKDSMMWHFSHSFKEEKVWVMGIKENGFLRSYAVFFRYDNEKYLLKRVRLIDFQTLKGENDDLLILLNYALKKATKTNVHMVEVFGFKESIQQIVKSRAPFERKLPSWLFFYKALNKDLEKRLDNEAVWNPTSFDGDGSL